ncbi:24639_t:CDS:2, partial [Gigaspora rosea]
INEETTLDSLDQLRQAQILSDNYFRISRENASDDPIAKVMAQAQQDAEQYDPELVRYALMVWVVHDPEARRRNLKIPPLGQRAPHITVPKLVNAVAEDPQLNEHHERWHIVFPAFPVNGVSKDREGENFAFMHRQMLARYDVERIAVGLQPVKAFSDYSEHIPESYNPDSDLVYDPNDDSNATILHFTPTTYRFGQQLYDGIEGKGEVTFGQDDESANRYGNILETTLHNTGHVMLAYIMTPNGANSQNTPPGNVDITIRVFLAPEELINSRVRWIELDKIRQTLKPNEKAVFSQNCDESVVIRKPAQKTPEQMDTTAITIEKRLETESLSEDQQSEAYFCDSFNKKCGSLSFCGSQQWDESYPDARRM